MKAFQKIIVLVFFSVLSQVSISQNNPADTNLYRILKFNNQEYVGRIINDDGREILIETSTLGKIFIPKSDIQSITIIHREIDIVDNEYRGTGVFTTRYQFSTNAFPIQKYDNYALINLYGPEVHFSISKNFSVGVMATWIASPIALALKYTIPTRNEKLNFGLGTLMGSAGYLNQGRGYGGLHWGMMTLGDRKNNFTLSAGYSYINTGQGSSYPVYQEGIYPATLSNGYWYFASLTPSSNYKVTDKVNAPIIGLAGIASIGKKASFVFDMMLLFGRKTQNDYYQNINNIYDPNTGNPSYTVVGPVQESQTSMNGLACVIMPGMRFQKSETRAFQVSLAGIIGSNKYQSNGQTTVNRYSFPIPMCTWFYKF